MPAYQVNTGSDSCNDDARQVISFCRHSRIVAYILNITAYRIPERIIAPKLHVYWCVSSMVFGKRENNAEHIRSAIDLAEMAHTIRECFKTEVFGDCPSQMGLLIDL